jgi:DNA helicase HerA-like ATPase
MLRLMAEPLVIAHTPDGTSLALLPALANRHGLITGATGTGKTVTMQVLAESFSRIGVPAFMPDVKGDVSGIAVAGTLSPKLKARLSALALEPPAWEGCPVVFWDVLGERGHPVRTTISDMGPLLLGRLLTLNDVQQGVLTLAFKIADDHGLLLLDLKDLRAMLQFLGDNAAEFKTTYGNVSAASVGAIQRGLLELEQQGGDRFFGEPMLDIADVIQTDGNGRGIVNLLAASTLINSPKLYSTFLLWLLAELFENLPEVGDRDKPTLVFFFDEAHLLFSNASEALIDKIEQVVRLIRSKGVGVFFVTQNAADIPDTVLSQLGNRVQHALRAYSPRDQRAVKVAAETLRANPSFDTGQAITELAVGEALVSLLDEHGVPVVVQRAWIRPPASQIGPASDAERAAIARTSMLAGHYEAAVDRESAYEKLKARTESRQPGQQAPPPSQRTASALPQSLDDLLFGSTGPRGGRREGMLESAAKSAARTIGSQVARSILRGALGSIVGKR